MDGHCHVVVLPSWYPSRISPLGGTFFREQALALRDAGVQVGVIAPEIVGLRAYIRARRPGTAIVRNDEGGIPTYRKIAVPLLPRFSGRNAWFWQRAGEALFAAYVHDHGLPDLVHAHSALYGGLLAHRLAAKTGIPYVVNEHHSAFARGRVRRWAQRSAGLAFADAAARLVVSPAVGSQLTAQFGEAFCPWQVIPDTLDSRFERPPEVRPHRDPGQFRFLCIGSFRKLKAQDRLISAFAMAFRGDPSVRLGLAGEGATLADCRTLASALDVASQVDFLGPLDRGSVKRELLASDALVVPSYYETFGVVVIEALACGLPVIATRCGGPESVLDESNGLLVPPGDVNSLAAALRQMRNDSGRYDSNTIRRDCLARYSNGAVARQLTTLYGTILAVGAEPMASPGAMSRLSA